MTQIETDLRAQLDALIDPNTQRAVTAGRQLQALQVTQGHVVVQLTAPYPGKLFFPTWIPQIRDACMVVPGVQTVTVDLQSQLVAHGIASGVPPLPGVKNIIAVASGKGGVGKSTTAVNLALSLQAQGACVGLLDADIYGPSQPWMLGIHDVQPEATADQRMNPVLAHGLQTMSIGYLIAPGQPMVWRGPMVTQALMQLLNETNWKDLDYLIMDLPPGTGDTPLTLAQRVPLTGVVIVTTPQAVALLDAEKGLAMFNKVKTPILGIIENMSMHQCAQCGHQEPLFGEGGGAQMGATYAVELLGQLPLDIAIRRHADAGAPTVVSAPDSDMTKIYHQIARRIAVRVSELPKNYASKFPKIVVQAD